MGWGWVGHIRCEGLRSGTAETTAGRSGNWTSLQEFEGATRLGATRPATLRGKWHSERVSERAFEKPLKTSKNLWTPLKTSQALSKPLKTSENLWNPPSQRSSQRPSQRQICLSEHLSPVAPNRVAPWNSYNIFQVLSKMSLVAETGCGRRA